MEQLPFVVKALTEGVRLSGRKPDERRPAHVEFGPQVGQCTVRLGTTVAMGTIDAKVVMPPPERPSEGIIQVSTQVSQLSQTDGNERYSGQTISTLIERLIRGSRVLDPESLCILNGRRVWQIKVVLHLVTHHGNAIDACGMAAIGALMHFRKQDVAIKGREIIVYSKETQEPTPLPLLHHPLIVSAAIVEFPRMHEVTTFNEDNMIVLIDPDRCEELASTTTLNIACNSAGDICLVNKAGGTPVPFHLLLRHIETIKHHATEMAQILTDALNAEQADVLKRRKNVHTRYTDVPIPINSGIF
eukprot:Gregarina_sp_Pseudo_9__5209@NODE_575_length_2558_cov_10_756252_g544_i0_p2_GENE_NODE_575_length_2558_cov_10_756252_g544_i0NODE_575_length_2558_cov_10_756252_g544_i0_p2_ORF_typecomplete_len302_score5_26RNase_PH/PF01138_21/3_8e14RNase_PH_C/PF03725_15/4_6e06Dynein_IC2/PF11540_8/0_0029_NODE_575_length_2558_cov_10_756252_g544_i011062011